MVQHHTSLTVQMQKSQSRRATYELTIMMPLLVCCGRGNRTALSRYRPMYKTDARNDPRHSNARHREHDIPTVMTRRTTVGKARCSLLGDFGKVEGVAHSQVTACTIAMRDRACTSLQLHGDVNLLCWDANQHAHYPKCKPKLSPSQVEPRCVRRFGTAIDYNERQQAWHTCRLESVLVQFSNSPTPKDSCVRIRWLQLPAT